MFESILQIQYCVLTSTILNGAARSAYIMQHKKSLFNTAVLGFQ